MRPRTEQTCLVVLSKPFPLDNLERTLDMAVQKSSVHVTGYVGASAQHGVAPEVARFVHPFDQVLIVRADLFGHRYTAYQGLGEEPT